MRLASAHTRSARRFCLSWLCLGMLLALPLRAQDGAPPAEPDKNAPEAKDKFANRPLNVGALGSQKVVVLPFGVVLVGDSALADTAAVRRWRTPGAGAKLADEAFSNALALRAPEVSWVLPDETRRLVRRASGLLPDAERLGQVVLLRNGAKTLPDPLRGNLRTLSAMGGGRYALVPGGLVFRADAEGTLAVLTLVIGDPRTGEVLWRSHAYGRGTTAEAALAAAFNATLPPEPSLP